MSLPLPIIWRSWGQSKEEDNFIAIVHIDGNEMGARFSESDSIESLRTLVNEGLPFLGIG